MTSNHYCITSKNVPLISAFKIAFRMTSRMTLRMTLKKWDFKGVTSEDFEGELEGYLNVSSRGCFMGTLRQLKGGLGGGLQR